MIRASSKARPTELESETLRRLAAVQTWQAAEDLWNWIGEQGNPEPLWDLMMLRLPWAFREAGNANSFLFGMVKRESR